MEKGGLIICPFSIMRYIKSVTKGEGIVKIIK